MKIFKLCKRYLLNNKYKLMLYILLNLIISGLSIVIPYLTGIFLDDLIKKNNINLIYKFCITRLMLFFLILILGYLSSKLFTKIQAKMSYEFNKDIISHVHRASLFYTNDLDYIYQSQLINNDTNSLIHFCITVIQSMFINFFTLISIFIILFKLNNRITFSMIIFIFMYIVSYYLFKKNIYMINKETSERKAFFITTLYEQLSLLKFVKSNSLYNTMNVRLEKSFKILFKSILEVHKYSYSFTSLDTLITTLTHIYIYFIGGIGIIKGQFTIGMFTVFLNYFTMLLGTVKYFYNFGSEYQGKLVSYDRLKEILIKPKEINGSKVLDKVKTIEIEKISFKYKNREEYVLRSLNLKFRIGNIYCILGSNGSGKSTLLDIINGFYLKEKEGSIKFNSIDIEDINMIKARKNIISYAGQESFLINDTIKYNIILEDRDFNDLEKEQIKYLSELIGFDSFVSKLPNGYNTLVNNIGSTISGGERKKISLLRSLFKQSSMLLLDEPTTALDSKSISRLQIYLSSIKKNKIIIIVTHDNNFASIADYVYTIDELSC